MNSTIAGKVNLIMELIGGQDIYDDYGYPTGDKTAPLITQEQALELLNSIPQAKEETA